MTTMTPKGFFPWLSRQDVQHELVDGVPLKILGVTREHADVAGNARAIFHAALKGTKWHVLNSQIGVKIPNGNVRYPDISVDTRGGVETDMWATDPVFSLLVFSDSPSQYAFEGIDRVEDFRTIPSLRYLLRVDAEKPRATLDFRADNGDWKHDKISLQATVNLPEIGLSFPLSDFFADRNMTTIEAAEYLDCSRPYVIMLCDEGKIHGVSKTVGGHRRIPLDSLVEWKNEHSHSGPPTYKEAATEAGMYDIPDDVCLARYKREHDI